MSGYTDSSIRFLKELRENSDLTWDEITDKWNEHFAASCGKKTKNALRKYYNRVLRAQNLAGNEELEDDAILKALETALRTSNSNKILRKQNTVLAEAQITLNDVVEGVESACSKVKFGKTKKIPLKKSNRKRKMTMEALLSDIHYGLKTSKDTTETTRAKMRKYAQVFISEYERYSKNYNVEKFIILLNGDIIQSATMHKNSSAASCDLTNAEQIAVAIVSLFEDLLHPIAELGVPVEVVGMSGNHDREQSDRFTVDPGKHYYTYSIYKSLELLCKTAKFKHIDFNIPMKAYHVYDVYGKSFLVEHGDLLGSKHDQKALESQIMKRAAQVNKIISGIRIGHFHNDNVGNCGRYIVNGGFPSEDHYGDLLGYKSRPCQIINYYVETHRQTSFYHSFAVNLE